MKIPKLPPINVPPIDVPPIDIPKLPPLNIPQHVGTTRGRLNDAKQQIGTSIKDAIEISPKKLPMPKKRMKQSRRLNKKQRYLVHWMYNYIARNMKRQHGDLADHDVQLLNEAIHRRFPKQAEWIIASLRLPETEGDEIEGT